MELEGYSRPTYNKLVHSATRRFTVVGVSGRGSTVLAVRVRYIIKAPLFLTGLSN